jgi:membrane-bound ClpP family serine protease
MYKNWINGLLGLVILGVAFLELSATTATWILGIVGAIIVINSFWSLTVEEDAVNMSPKQKSHM